MIIQIRAKLNPEINSKDYEGVYIKVYGNEKNYNLHLRTGLTLAPWQYYSYTFVTTKNWIEIRAPFKQFKKSNFYQPKSILGQNSEGNEQNSKIDLEKKDFTNVVNLGNKK